MNGSGPVAGFLDGATAAETCPASKDGKCPSCGGGRLYPLYGCGSGYGMGAYSVCEGCDTVLDFHPDSDGAD